MQKFWMVWRMEGGDRGPTVMHDSEESACAEAERLARAHAGTFVVLEAVKAVKKTDVQWRYLGDDEAVNIPF